MHFVHFLKKGNDFTVSKRTKKSKKSTYPKRSRTFMYVQQTDKLKEQGIKLSQLAKVLQKSAAYEWAFIEHNKDKHEDGTPKANHVHVVLRFKDAKTSSSVSKIFNDAKPQNSQFWKEGTIGNAYSYCLHEPDESRNEPGNHHYSDSEVVANFDFHARMEKIRAQVKKHCSKKSVEADFDAFYDGEITEEELTKRVGNRAIIENMVNIERAKKLLAKQKHQQFLEKYKGKQMLTFYLYGSSGVGKSFTARELLKEVAPDNFIVLGSSRDILAPYNGQNYVLFDDFRAGQSGLEYSDLLRILDPQINTKYGPARYHDKVLSLLVVIITSVYSPHQLWQASVPPKQQKIDTFKQLSRRIYSFKITKKNRTELKQKILKKLKAQGF